MPPVADARRPKLFAAACVQGDEEFALLSASHRKEPLSGDGHTGVAFAQSLGLPEDRRTVAGPLLEQSGLSGDAVAIGPAPLRPLAVRAFDIARAACRDFRVSSDRRFRFGATRARGGGGDKKNSSQRGAYQDGEGFGHDRALKECTGRNCTSRIAYPTASKLSQESADDGPVAQHLVLRLAGTDRQRKFAYQAREIEGMSTAALETPPDGPTATRTRRIGQNRVLGVVGRKLAAGIVGFHLPVNSAVDVGDIDRPDADHGVVMCVTFSRQRVRGLRLPAGASFALGPRHFPKTRVSRHGPWAPEQFEPVIRERKRNRLGVFSLG